ncbi:MAG: hypothetical protein BWZ02_01012 [Lentisphaerae bacterium ADurb.BinA184]|nr:MAG: hypothetical protein BWZ02_01012 [Lentisphaerae bacterium ADurb.BinA184]
MELAEPERPQLPRPAGHEPEHRNGRQRAQPAQAAVEQAGKGEVGGPRPRLGNDPIKHSRNGDVPRRVGGADQRPGHQDHPRPLRPGQRIHEEEHRVDRAGPEDEAPRPPAVVQAAAPARDEQLGEEVADHRGRDQALRHVEDGEVEDLVVGAGKKERQVVDGKGVQVAPEGALVQDLADVRPRGAGLRRQRRHGGVPEHQHREEAKDPAGRQHTAQAERVLLVNAFRDEAGGQGADNRHPAEELEAAPQVAAAHPGRDGAGDPVVEQRPGQLQAGRGGKDRGQQREDAQPWRQERQRQDRGHHDQRLGQGHTHDEPLLVLDHAEEHDRDDLQQAGQAGDERDQPDLLAGDAQRQGEPDEDECRPPVTSRTAPVM